MGLGCGLQEGVGRFREVKDMTDKRENTAVRPLSVEAEEFSLGTGPRNRVSDGGGDFLPSYTGSRVI